MNEAFVAAGLIVLLMFCFVPAVASSSDPRDREALVRIYIGFVAVTVFGLWLWLAMGITV